MGRWIGPVGFIAAAMAALLLPMRASLAWGPEGHRVIALIADRALQQSDPDVRAKILAVLATDKGSRLTKNDIASEATWADVLREKSEEARSATGAWHSVRFKPDNPDLALACFGRNPLPSGYPASHGPRDNCSVDKIQQFAAELKDPETSAGERLAALQFLLNLVGDLNDPLHAIDRGDQGGACVALQIGSKPPVRLSTYWGDTLVAEVVGPDPAKVPGRSPRRSRRNGRRATRKPGPWRPIRSPRPSRTALRNRPGNTVSRRARGKPRVAPRPISTRPARNMRPRRSPRSGCSSPRPAYASHAYCATASNRAARRTACGFSSSMPIR